MENPFVTSAKAGAVTRSLPSRFGIDPVCSGRVKSRCLSPSKGEGGGVGCGGGGAQMTWRGQKFCSVKNAGRRFPWQRRAATTESFDLGGN